MIKGKGQSKRFRITPIFKDYMKLKKLKNLDLADITGYSIGTIDNLTRGKPVSKGVVQVLARELEINQDLIAEVVEA